VYPRSAPKRICDTHLANEAANVRRCRRLGHRAVERQ
jgi:hypothetical protein